MLKTSKNSEPYRKSLKICSVDVKLQWKRGILIQDGCICLPSDVALHIVGIVGLLSDRLKAGGVICARLPMSQTSSSS